MSSTLLVENVDISDPPESELLNSVKLDIDEKVDLRNEPFLGDFYNEESEYFIDQIKDKNGKVWSEEVFLTTCNSHFVKTETSENFNGRNNCTVHIFPKLEVKNELNEVKIEEAIEDSHSTKHRNYLIQNDDTECTMTQSEDTSRMCSTVQPELAQKKCDLLTSIDSVKTETSEDLNEESKYIINQIIDENGKVWPEKDFLTSWSFHSVKMEMNEDSNCKIKSTKSKKKDVNEMLSSIQMELSPPKCVLPPKGMDYIHLKLENRKGYSCHLCDFRSSWKAILHEHIQSVHVKLKNNKSHYSHKSRCLQKSNLQVRIKSVFLNLRSHKCHLCDFSTSLKAALQRHIKSVHLKLRDHKCHLCDYSSSQRTTVQRHIKSVHLKLRSHKCHLCDYSSSHKGDLQRHIKSVHLKLRGHKCHLCDYTSSQKAAVRRHINSVHLKLRSR